MIEITEKEFENRKDYYCDKAESGTVVLVEKPDGAKILVVPQNPNDLNYDYPQKPRRRVLRHKLS